MKFGGFHFFSTLKGLAVTAIVLVTFSGCSLRDRTPVYGVSVALPKEWSAHRFSKRGALSSALVDPPYSIGDFDCYALNVKGAGIQPDPKFQCGANSGMGILAGLVPVTQGQMDVMVPAGASRTVQLIGVKSNIGCPKLDQVFSSSANSQGMSEEIGESYLLGETTIDVFDDVAATIYADFDPNNIMQMGCNDNNQSGSGGGSVISYHMPNSSFVVQKDQCIPLFVKGYGDEASLPTVMPLVIEKPNDMNISFHDSPGCGGNTVNAHTQLTSVGLHYYMLTSGSNLGETFTLGFQVVNPPSVNWVEEQKTFVVQSDRYEISEYNPVFPRAVSTCSQLDLKNFTSANASTPSGELGEFSLMIRKPNISDEFIKVYSTAVDCTQGQELNYDSELEDGKVRNFQFSINSHTHSVFIKKNLQGSNDIGISSDEGLAQPAAMNLCFGDNCAPPNQPQGQVASVIPVVSGQAYLSQNSCSKFYLNLNKGNLNGFPNNIYFSTSSSIAQTHTISYYNTEAGCSAINSADEISSSHTYSVPAGTLGPEYIEDFYVRVASGSTISNAGHIIITPQVPVDWTQQPQTFDITPYKIFVTGGVQNAASSACIPMSVGIQEFTSGSWGNSSLSGDNFEIVARKDCNTQACSSQIQFFPGNNCNASEINPVTSNENYVQRKTISSGVINSGLTFQFSIRVNAAETIRFDIKNIGLNKMNQPASFAMNFSFPALSVPVLTGPAGLVSSVAGATIFYDQNSSISLSGTCQAGATVRIFLNGSVYSSTSCSANNDFTITVSEDSNSPTPHEVKMDQQLDGVTSNFSAKYYWQRYLPPPTLNNPPGLLSSTNAAPFELLGSSIVLSGTCHGTAIVQAYLNSTAMPNGNCTNGVFNLNLTNISQDSSTAKTIHLNQFYPGNSPSSNTPTYFWRNTSINNGGGIVNNAIAAPAITSPPNLYLATSSTSPYFYYSNSISISGSCQPNATLVIEFDGVNQNTTCSASGTFTFPFYSIGTVPTPHAINLMQIQNGSSSSWMGYRYWNNAVPPMPEVFSHGQTFTSNSQSTIHGNCVSSATVTMMSNGTSTTTSCASNVFSFVLLPTSLGTSESRNITIHQTIGGLTSNSTNLVWNYNPNATSLVFVNNPTGHFYQGNAGLALNLSCSTSITYSISQLNGSMVVGPTTIPCNSGFATPTVGQSLLIGNYQVSLVQGDASPVMIRWIKN